MTFQSMEFWLVAVLLTLAVLTGFALFARWCAYSPAVRRAQMDKICVGMTTSEVVAIIGQPREARKTTEGVRHWIYGSRTKRHVLMLEFSAQDRLVSFAHGVPGAGNRSAFPAKYNS